MWELTWLTWPSGVEGTEVCSLIRNSLRCKHLVFWAPPRRAHEVNKVLYLIRHVDEKGPKSSETEIEMASPDAQGCLKYAGPCCHQGLCLLLSTPLCTTRVPLFPALNRSMDTSYRWMANSSFVSFLAGPQGSWSFRWKEWETEAPKTAQDLRDDEFRTPPQMDCFLTLSSLL